MQGEGTVQLRDRGFWLRALVTGPAWLFQRFALSTLRLTKGCPGGLRPRSVHLPEVKMG